MSAATSTATRIALLALMFASLFAPRWIAPAQEPPRLKFEVASVKRNASSATRGEMHFEAARFVATWRSLRNLIMEAYGVQNYQIFGFPSSLESVQYDVEGKSAQPASKGQLQLMLQSLLAERFKLKLHREMKEMSVYILSVGKNEPKLEVAKETERSIIGLVPQQQGDRTAYELIAQKVPIGGLTGMLTAQLGRPVLDQTGLSGDFNFKAEIAAGDSAQVAQIAGGEPTTEKAAIVAIPPAAMISAVQADLGLRLESAKAAVEILVIDHAEQPDAN